MVQLQLININSSIVTLYVNVEKKMKTEITSSSIVRNGKKSDSIISQNIFNHQRYFFFWPRGTMTEKNDLHPLERHKQKSYCKDDDASFVSGKSYEMNACT
ncbi:hypothetical protein CEXT_438281 [Caerostris extrusa]|uniref:Ycf1 n=1 Tax=Caerostris extrusa TaxID=172846 RepID=A0AAV4VSV5_CAEEX|nr:hypothetical protein CEXT_438281 [Caerostris extrusa]